MAQTYLAREIEALVDAEIERHASLAGERVSRAEMVRLLVLEVRRLRLLEARVQDAGARALGGRGLHGGRNPDVSPEDVKRKLGKVRGAGGDRPGLRYG